MKNKKSVFIMSLVTLVLSYFIIRYALFEMHGMKQWTLVMSGLAVVVLAVSTYFNKQNTMMISTLGLIISFMIGMTLRTTSSDQGLSNGWLIWIVSYLILVGIGVFLDVKKES